MLCQDKFVFLFFFVRVYLKFLDFVLNFIIILDALFIILMHFKIVNCPDRDFKPYVEKAASFFAKELISNTRIRNNCHTLIIFNNNFNFVIT